MLDTLTRPTQDADQAAEFTPEWHRQQEAEERAWLDDYARARRLVTAA